MDRRDRAHRATDHLRQVAEQVELP